MKEIRLGIAGLGTVAQGVLKLLASNHDLIANRTGVTLSVARVASRSAKPEVDLAGAEFSTDLAHLYTDDRIDIVLELIGGETVAYPFIEQALAAGKPVVTANKAVVAAHGNTLLGGNNTSPLCFEAG